MDSLRHASVRGRATSRSDLAAAAYWRGVRDEHGCLVDIELVDASEGFVRWLELTRETSVGRRYTELMPTGIHDRLAVYLRALQEGELARLAFRRHHTGTRPVDVEVLAVPVGDDELFSVLLDVTDTRQRVEALDHERLQAVEERDLLRTALDASPDAVAICRLGALDTDDLPTVVVEYVNEAAHRSTGHLPQAWVGTDVREWFGRIGQEELGRQIAESAVDHLPRRLRVDASAEGGWAGPVDAVVTPVGSDRLIASWRPVDGRTAPPVIQTAVASTDPLTGLLTRGEFRRRAAQWLRSADPVSGLVVAVDIDDFGRLNDIVGPRKADQALAEFGAEIHRMEPWAVLGARIGSDEVLALVPGPVDVERIDLLQAQLARILASIASRLSLPPLSVSAGVRILDRDVTVEEILRDCDTAVRHAQRNGGARVTVFDEEVRHSLLLDYLWAEDIRNGLVAGDFVFAYQPIVEVATGVSGGVEALLRWNHPELGLLTPDRFIPIAEATGTIVDLGGWAIDRGVARLAEIASGGYVGINVSGVQLLQTDVPALVAAALERHRVDPGRFVVEITESAILPESVRIRGQLAEIRTMGVKVAVDDFGSGYSSIAYLDWIPADVVKLDRRFLLGDLDARRLSLLTATVGLVRSVGALALVEGVETQEQLEIVRAAGADLAQGYFFGRPQLGERV